VPTSKDDSEPKPPHPSPPHPSPARNDSPRAAIHRQSLSIALALAPFGVAFGIAATHAGMSAWLAVGYSTLVFSGSAQFAAVSTLGAGGGVAAAVTAGVLLNLRSLAFGLSLANDLDRPLWRRALLSQLMIDESTAVATAQHDPRWRRYGYLCAGCSVFVVWNVTTLVGAVLLSDADSIVHDFGIDATIPAAFLALIWPRLAGRNECLIAMAGATIAFALIPLMPAGIPIIAAVVAIALDRPLRRRAPSP
jgi:4-azaleucine resistance transporter AzlC